jgi:dipeptidyl aminopeptidase/acylaminoacyl peptidase
MKKLRLFCLIGLVFGVQWAALAAEAQVPIKDFAKDDVWREVKISPKGEYISAVTKIKGKRAIVIMDASNLKILHSLNFKDKAQAGAYYWASADRIVTEKQYFHHWWDQPLTRGELFSVKADGSKGLFIFGVRKAKKSFKSYDRPFWGEMVDPMPDDDRFVLIKGTPYSKAGEADSKLFLVNIKLGSKKLLTRAPVMWADFITDQNNEVRFATGSNKQGEMLTYQFKDQQWLSTGDMKVGNESFDPLSIKGDSNQVYAYYSPDSGVRGLYLFDLDSGKKELIYRHENVDVSTALVDRSGEVYAAHYDDGYATTRMINTQHPEAKVLQKLMKTLQGYSVSVISETLDGNTKVVFARNQFNPGDYLLYDVKKDELSFMFSRRPWVNADIAANMVPFKFKARDGLDLSAYVTLPLGADLLSQAKNLPFVVRVHGGPKTRDYMGYDNENQLYASRGIAVLQVNFRGSSGYGQKFEEKGDKHWGDHIQFDIIDGIKALVAQGVADKNRLCIVGGSFGAYSALQSAIIEPDLFKCAVGQAGIYDLAMMYEEGDVQARESGKAYLKKVIGTDKVVLKAMSPLYHLDKLKAPVLIIHGGQDQRAPVEHAELLKQGLSGKKLAHEWMLMKEEGHGIYNPVHREKAFDRVIRFLSKHLMLVK